MLLVIIAFVNQMSLHRVLAANGSDKTRILMCQIFLKDISEIGEMNKVWDAWVSPGNAPARATVQSRSTRSVEMPM